MVVLLQVGYLSVLVIQKLWAAWGVGREGSELQTEKCI